jgi:zinc protease
VPALTHPDIPALDLLGTILGGGRSSRFYLRLREELKLVHSIDAWCYAPAHPGLFGVDAILDPEHRDAVQETVFAMLAEIVADGVTPAELDKAKKLALSHQLHALTTMRGKANDLGANWLLTRNLDFSRDYLEAIQRVTVEDVQRALATYCHSGNAIITSLNPEGSMAAVAAPAAALTAGEILKFELANGLRLLVREDPRLPLVSVAATFKAGLLAETEEDNGITRLLAKVLLKGTSTRTAEQLADEIEAVGGSISSDGGNNSLSIGVKVMEPDLALGMELLADVLLNATLPGAAIEREKEVQLASIKAEDEEMTVVARNLLRRNLFAGHAYGRPALGSPESVERLDDAALRAFRDRYLVAKNGVIAVFGNVRAQEVKDLVERLLGSSLRASPR